jgi:hypothetical protein
MIQQAHLAQEQRDAVVAIHNGPIGHNGQRDKAMSMVQLDEEIRRGEHAVKILNVNIALARQQIADAQATRKSTNMHDRSPVDASIRMTRSKIQEAIRVRSSAQIRLNRLKFRRELQLRVEANTKGAK